MINKAFEVINKKVFSALEPQGYTAVKVKSSDSNELTALYTGSDTAYMVIYYKDKKHVVLRTCDMENNEPDNRWKTLSTWMFDPVTDSTKEAENIGNDFFETLDNAPKAAIANKNLRKRRKNEDGNGDPIFFMKRLVAVFPELKDDIKYEETNYFPFRYVKFSTEKVVPLVNKLLAEGDRKRVEKLGDVLSSQYDYGDLDVRSCITIVILNSVDSPEKEKLLWDYLNPILQKAWKAAKHFKGKKVKPEKQKKQRSFMADTLPKGQ